VGGADVGCRPLARYDRRRLLRTETPGRLPIRWNNFTSTIDIGHDMALAENLRLRPIVNLSGGYAAADRTVLADILRVRRGGEAASTLGGAHVTAFGLGGALTLAYCDYRPERDIDVALRFWRCVTAPSASARPASIRAGSA
jgi:hypothetical protein